VGRIVGSIIGIALATSLAGFLLGQLLGWLSGLGSPSDQRKKVSEFLQRMDLGLGWGLLCGGVAIVTRKVLTPGWEMMTGFFVIALLVGIGGAVRSLSWIPYGALLGVVVTVVLRFPPGPGTMAVVEAEPAKGPHVVLITMDTFRADHLGSIPDDFHNPTTPHLDKLAESGVLYTQGEAVVPLTLPSHTSMLTGRPGYASGVVQNGDNWTPDVRSIAQEFREAGYRTGAFVTAYVLRSAHGTGRGFEHYDDRMGLLDFLIDGKLAWGIVRAFRHKARPVQRSGAEAVERALRWLKSDDRPAFMWVHLYDPHAPYEPPAPYDKMYAHDSDTSPGNKDQLEKYRPLRQKFAGLMPGMRPRDLRQPVAMYAGEISWTDELVGKVLAELPAESPVIVTADHGESLIEHGFYLNHGNYVYEPSTRVPIIVRAPGKVTAGTRVDDAVTLARVGDTLRVIGGLAGDANKALLGQAEPRDPYPEIISYGPPQTARMRFELRPEWLVSYRQGPEKWIVNGRGEIEYYDLILDPGELNNLAQQSADTEAVQERGQAFLAELREMVKSNGKKSDEVMEALKELGYIE
jgi:arylsulfatase A-like enzyme